LHQLAFFKEVDRYLLLRFCIHTCCGSSPAEECGSWW